MLEISGPEGAIKVKEGSRIKDILDDLTKRRSDVVAAKVEDELKDLSFQIKKSCNIIPVFKNSPEGLDILRHSTSHVMALAVTELYPGVKVTIGPSIEEGFYYDFDAPKPFSEDDLKKIEKKMKEIIKANEPFERIVMPKSDALKFFENKGEKYKVEILNELEDPEVSMYRVGSFTDLCRGPHLPSSGRIKALKLLSVSGAYWRGDENKASLQRIYGTAFYSKEELSERLKLLEEAKKRDHRRLGKELDLYSVNDLIGGGLVLWHPKGAKVRELIETYWKREHEREGYSLVYSPHIAKVNLWQTSGHMDFYRDYLYSPMDVEGLKYMVKPMNCPFHIQIYKSQLRSYRELPIKYAELGTVYRYERAGVLHGLLRVRGFTQDDAHVFCRPDQLNAEIKDIMQMTISMLKHFGFDKYEVFLSTRPEKFVGCEKNWQRATNALESALKDMKLEYSIDPGEGVFYGPKIDIKIKDSLGRSWQCTTCQVDFNLPEKFAVEYVDKDNTRVEPIMVHRALLGSLERFMGCLIEHYNGSFPLWLAPVQLKIITIKDDNVDYAKKISSELRSSGYRVEEDYRSEKLNYKIREAQLAKVPYMLIIGDGEMSANTVSIRERDGKQHSNISLEELKKMLNGKS